MTSSPEIRSTVPANLRARWAGLVCGLAGAALFQFFGNANRGYIDSASLFYWWGFQWVNPRSETQHGWLVLAMSTGLFWWNLRRLDDVSLERSAGVPPASDENGTRDSCATAFAAMLAGLVLHAAGFAAQQARISIVALLFFAWGVLRLAGGRRWGRAAAFPLGFLVFAIPINALDSAGFWLRMWVVDASTWLAHAAGIGVLRSGTQLVAPDGRYNYDVAAACSGVRSFTALAALALLAGYLSFRSFWRRAFALLLCFPLVYVGNVVRIAAIIFAAHFGGQVWGDRAHAVMGPGVFVIVLGGVLMAMSALSRWTPEREEEPRDSRQGSETSAPSRNGGKMWVGAMAVAVVGLVSVEMILLRRLAQLPPRGDVGIVLAQDGRNPVDLPAFLGTSWIGSREEVTAVEREILPPDTGFSRRLYTVLGGGSKQVYLSIVLSGRDRTSIHRPELCLVGQGWTIADTMIRSFTYPTHPEATFPATVLQVKREVQTARGRVVVPQYVAYWFVGADTVVATHWQRLARDAWNRVSQARADRWAYVLMQTDAADGEAAAMARMQAVLDASLPVFQRPMAVP